VPALDMFGPPKFVFTLIIIFTTFDMAFTNIALTLRSPTSRLRCSSASPRRTRSGRS
jgi:hypothetical protein